MCTKILEGRKVVISSNEFVLFYNELFKYLDKNFGKGQVEKLWKDISKSKYCKKLDDLVKGKGIKGIYEYWKEILTEEGARYELTIRDDEFFLDMHLCPSLDKLFNTHVKPYKDYCSHCPSIYIPIYEKYGLKGVRYFIDMNKGQCRCYVWKE